MKLDVALAVLLGGALFVGPTLVLASPMAAGFVPQWRNAEVEKIYLLCDSWGNCWETDPYNNPPYINHRDWERDLNRGEDYSYGRLVVPDALRGFLTGQPMR